MFLVVMHIFATNQEFPCVIAETEDKAQEWIDKEMEDRVYNGGVHRIRLITLYK